MNNKSRAAFYTLGCKVNQNETEALMSMMKDKGYNIVDFTDEADIYIINTCTVTHLADRKSRQFIRRALKLNPSAKVAVMGCYSQMSPEEVQKIPGVSLVLGTTEKSRLLEWLDELKENSIPTCHVEGLGQGQIFEELPSLPHDDKPRVRAFLKVQEGCEQFCSYCIIPYARGPLRSRTLDNSILEARQLIEAGYKEIVLTGIHLGAYGRDMEEDVSLETLVEKLLALEKGVRWRLSSLEPTEVSSKLIELIAANENLCPHLHLPLQSGHNQILEAMNRPYSIEEYEEIIKSIRGKVPHIAITTDVMVGFPGESEEHFQSYLEFVGKIGFSGLHVFQYSPRRGTPASTFPNQISTGQKEERSRRLIELGKKLSHKYAQGFIGKTLEVLVESKGKDGNWEGHSANYLKIGFSFPASRGALIPLKIIQILEDGCWGEIV